MLGGEPCFRQGGSEILVLRVCRPWLLPSKRTKFRLQGWKRRSAPRQPPPCPVRRPTSSNPSRWKCRFRLTERGLWRAATSASPSPRPPRPFLFSATAPSSVFLLPLLRLTCVFSPLKN